MVWMTTPDEIQALKAEKFPLANPAASPIQPQVQQASVNVILQRARKASAHQSYSSDVDADAAFAEMMAMSAAEKDPP